jgi:hypothetical protein
MHVNYTSQPNGSLFCLRCLWPIEGEAGLSEDGDAAQDFRYYRTVDCTTKHEARSCQAWYRHYRWTRTIIPALL